MNSEKRNNSGQTPLQGADSKRHGGVVKKCYLNRVPSILRNQIAKQVPPLLPVTEPIVFSVDKINRRQPMTY